MGAGGVESWQDDSTQNENGGGVESSWDNSNPRGGGVPRGDETLGGLTSSQYRQGEGGWGRGGRKPTHCLNNQGATT